MPELPEVETMRRGIAGAAGATISRIVQPKSPLQSIIIVPSLREFRRRAVGRQIAGVGRLGKRVLLELDSGERIVIEPRMTGLVFLADPPDHKHLRLVIELSGRPGLAEQILFWDQRGLGVVRLVSPPEFDAIYGPAKIGPDALEISATELRQRIGHSTRAIKVALLDQKALAGVGNLYASEILHRAGIHPARSCRHLRKAQWQRVHAEMLSSFTTQSSTKARHSATAPIASPAMCRAIISSITASTSGTVRPAWAAEWPGSCESCRPSDRRSIVRRASESSKLRCPAGRRLCCYKSFAIFA